MCYSLYTVHIIYYKTWRNAKYIAFASAGIIKSPFSGNSCARKMCHLLLAGYEDAPSFLNQRKLNRSLCYSLYTVHRLIYYKTRRNAKYSLVGFAGIIKSPFSGNSCARKMCHLLLAGYEDAPSFLNQWKLNRSLYYSLYTVQYILYYKTRRNAKYSLVGFSFAGIIKSPFSGNSCARKMCHLLLAGYEVLTSRS